MSFLAPWVLLGGLTAGIPIVIHFLFRSRYRTIPWAAMDFLLKSVEQTRRRIRFQELLLLLLRIALLLLLALALARPAMRAGSGSAGGEAVDAVLLIDTSLSMDARDGASTRLDQAKAAALAVVDHLPLHSTVQVITYSDRAANLGPRRPSDFDHARELINGITVTSRTGDLATGLTAAVETLRRGASPQRELYIFSDGQTLGFEQQPAAVLEAGQAARQLAAVYFAHCGRPIAHNATIVGVAPQTGVPHTGERVGFAILIKNTGLEPLRDLTVSLTLDNDERRRETQPLPRLEPGESRAVTLTGRWADPGLHIVTARVHSDDLNADDRFDRVIRVRDRVRLLVVDGAPSTREPEKSASFYLLQALVPVKDTERSRYYLQPRVVSPSQTAPALLADQDVCILTNVALGHDANRAGEVLGDDFVEALYRFVRDGKTVLIFAGDRVQPADYNRLLLDRVPLLPLRLGEVRSREENAEAGFDRGSIVDPALVKFREDENYKTLAQVRTRKSIDADELPGDADARMLLRYTDGRPALAERRVGAGRSALITTSADVSWNDLPLWGNISVPLIDSLMAHLLLAETDAHNTTAGVGIRWFAPNSDGDRPFVLDRPDGAHVRLGVPEPIKGRPRVIANDTPIAGLYKLHPADAPEAGSATFAVICDINESLRPELSTAERINERLGISAVHLNAADELSDFRGGARAKREWTPRLLWLLLLVALAESGFAWWVNRPR